jgi:hypothetical protein
VLEILRRPVMQHALARSGKIEQDAGSRQLAILIDVRARPCCAAFCCALLL